MRVPALNSSRIGIAFHPSSKTLGLLKRMSPSSLTARAQRLLSLHKNLAREIHLKLCQRVEDAMPTATEKPSWATSGESLLNVPQTERSDDDGEPSEMKSGDRPSLTGKPLAQPVDMVAQTGTGSTASPEAPLVSDGKKAPPEGSAEADMNADKSTAARK